MPASRKFDVIFTSLSGHSCLLFTTKPDTLLITERRWGRGTADRGEVEEGERMGQRETETDRQSDSQTDRERETERGLAGCYSPQNA